MGQVSRSFFGQLPEMPWKRRVVCPGCDGEGGQQVQIEMPASAQVVLGYQLREEWQLCTLCGGEGMVLKATADEWLQRELERWGPDG